MSSNSDSSTGRASDGDHALSAAFEESILQKFEMHSYRNAATILSQSFPDHHKQISDALKKFRISKQMIRTPGGSKSIIATYFDTLFDASWVETRIAADLNVKLMHAKKNSVIQEYVREGYLDGHRIDFVNGRVALDFEWNSKDQTYDRDLYAFSAFYEAGAIDIGIIVTRGASLDAEYFRSLGKVIDKNGEEGDQEVYRKYGASTTWIGKLLYRLDAGRNGGCPVLAIGITPSCVLGD